MINSKREVWRLLGLVAVFVLAQAQASSLIVEGAGLGRDFARCVQLCNTFKGLCDQTCMGDCDILFTQGTAEFEECVSWCKSGCNDEMTRCKARCNVNKYPPSSTEP